MTEVLRPDICVIGGGPGGIAAARTAVQAGVSAVLIEKRMLGGANLTAGAVPLAALMSAAALHAALRRGPQLGVSAAPLQVNWAKVREHVMSTAATLAVSFSAEHLTAEGIRVIAARARFVDKTTVAAGEAVIRARRFIIAVGGRAGAPTLPGLENVEPLSPAEIFDFSRKISHLIVIGGSAAGLAIAQAHQRLGIDATVIDEGPLLPAEDPELVKVLAAHLSRDGVRVRSQVRVERITRRRGGVRVVLDDPTEGEIALDASHIVLAMTRRPAVDGLGLDAAGIAHDDDGVTVRRFRTANRRVYAIGDAIAGEASVRRAESEGRAVVEGILFRRRPRIAIRALPRMTATDPPLVAIGLGEEAMRKRAADTRLWRFPFAATERSLVERQPDGVVKVIATKRGRILGAAVLGPDAAEHIALWALAMDKRLRLPALASLAAVYPSRADAARALADAGTRERLTAPWRRGIIRLLGKLG